MQSPEGCGSVPIEIGLVVGGKWHDFDFARLQILQLLMLHEVVQCTVYQDFSEIEKLVTAQAIIVFTCDVRPTAQQVDLLTESVEAGMRLLALHATNSAIDPPQRNDPSQRNEPIVFRTPNVMPKFTELLGNRFLAHPKIAPFRVDVARPEHPLVAGITSFTTTDELYVVELGTDLNILLDSEFTGECPGFEVNHSGTRGRHPILYTRTVGTGEVIYFTLGHCRGRFDLRDLGVSDTHVTDRVAWESPEFRKILRRGIAWAVHGDTWEACRAAGSHLEEEKA